MGLFDGLGDMVAGLQPGGVPPGMGTPNPSPLGAASSGIGDIVRGMGVPASALPGAMGGGGGGAGAPGAPAGVPSPAQGAGTPAPGGASTPPDLSQLYTKLLREERSRRDIDSGMALIAAGFSSPQSRAALINYAGRPQDQDGSAGQQLNTLVGLYNNSVKMQQYQAMQRRIPILAKQLGMSEEQVRALADGGKLDDLIKQRGEIKGTVVQNADGTHSVVDEQHGNALSNTFGPLKTEITKNAENQPISVVPATGKTVGGPIGPAHSELPTDNQRVLSDANASPEKYGLPPLSDNSPDAQQKRAMFATGLFNKSAVTINNAAESEYQKKMGSGEGDRRNKAIDAGQTNRSLINNLDVMQDALNRAEKSGTLTTGPFAQKSLEMKEALGSAFGVQIPGTSEAEVAQHVQTTVATQAAKALTARPSQMEFQKFLQNTPGASMSVPGMRALVDITKQDAQARVEIAKMAADPRDKRSTAEIEDTYFKEHPILSAFDHSKPLGVDDVLKINPPDQRYIDRLRSGKGSVEGFDSRFGPGAAQRYLQQQPQQRSNSPAPRQRAAAAAPPSFDFMGP